MALRKLSKTQWKGYFDRLSKASLGKRAEIEIAGLGIGDQIEADWLVLFGVTYDAKDDAIEIALDGVDHLINNPREVYVEEAPAGVAAIEIVDGGDLRQIVRLRDPLMLPAHSGV